MSSDNINANLKNNNDLLIEIKDLKKEYGNVKAINGINFSVQKGEIFGFLGPNGAGKTTTISILLGLEKPDKGEALVFGKNSSSFDKEIYRKIGVVFEEKNLYLRLSGYQNLKFFSEMYGVAEKRINYLLEKLGLAEAAHRQVKNYSKGMKQRLLICRALLNDPELLILDEPTGGLDPLSLKIIHDSIKEFKEAGKTVFLSTHYMEEADSLCDRLAFINKGNIIVIDSPEELKNKYGEEVIEIKALPEKFEGNKKQFISKIKKHLMDEDSLFMDDIYVTICLSLKGINWGERLNRMKKYLKIKSIHSREGSLHDVFLKLAR
ncbi:MAG: ABC transporter ATP-binding protein [Bacillota bacterium]